MSKFVGTVWELTHQGQSVSEIISAQEELVKRGQSLWDYPTWFYLFGKGKVHTLPAPTPVVVKEVKPVKEKEPLAISFSKDTIEGMRNVCYIRGRFDLAKHIPKMTPLQQELLCRRYQHKFSIKRIARDMDMSDSLCKAEMQKAMNQMAYAQFNIAPSDTQWADSGWTKRMLMMSTPNVIAFVVQHYFLERTWKEVADYYGVSPSTPCALVGAAKRRVKEELAK